MKVCWQLRQTRLFSDRRDPLRQRLVRLDLRGLAVHRFRTDEIQPLLENLTDLDERCGIGGVELRGLAELRKRRLRIAATPLDDPELAMQQRAVRRRLDRPPVRRTRLVQPTGLRSRARAFDGILRAFEAEY